MVLVTQASAADAGDTVLWSGAHHTSGAVRWLCQPTLVQTGFAGSRDPDQCRSVSTRTMANLTRWDVDVVMKVAELGDWKHQHEMASLDDSLFRTTSCPRLTSNASLVEECLPTLESLGLCGTQTSWNKPHGTVWLRVNHVCVTGSWPHWAAVFSDGVTKSHPERHFCQEMLAGYSDYNTIFAGQADMLKREWAT